MDRRSFLLRFLGFPVAASFTPAVPAETRFDAMKRMLAIDIERFKMSSEIQREYFAINKKMLP